MAIPRVLLRAPRSRCADHRRSPVDGVHVTGERPGAGGRWSVLADGIERPPRTGRLPLPPPPADATVVHEPGKGPAMVVQHRDLVIDARTPPALPRWRVGSERQRPSLRLLPILRAGIDPAAPVWNLAELLGLDDAADVGMDVAYLADLYARGFSVPPAFALGIAAYQESVEAGGVRGTRADRARAELGHRPRTPVDLRARPRS